MSNTARTQRKGTFGNGSKRRASWTVTPLVVGIVVMIGFGLFNYDAAFDTSRGVENTLLHLARVDTASAIASFTSTSSSPYPGWDPANPLGIPQGQAPNLPSIRDSTSNAKRANYGGQGDKPHLGGFTEFDIQGLSPHVWKHMIQDYGVHSVLDVGCGRGISTSWFHMHGVQVLCVEGSHDAVQNSVLPDPANQVVEHDFSRGPWWPRDTFDAVWAVEFLEHVNVQYHFNYIAAMRKAALLFVSSSRWGGWHHVEVHQDDWWIRKYELYGFRYDDTLTQQVREWATEESRDVNATTAPNAKPWNAQHVWLSMKVFVNPAVAALPAHAHLFPENGCFQGRGEGGRIHNRECGTGKDAALETKLDPAMSPLTLDPSMDTAWTTHIQRHLAKSQSIQSSQAQ